MGLKGVPHAKTYWLTDWLTVSRKVTLTLTMRKPRECLQACSLLRAAAGSWGLEQFGNPEGSECPPLETLTKQRSEDSDWEHKSVCDSDL
jgi:hypothetical protein